MCVGGGGEGGCSRQLLMFSTIRPRKWELQPLTFCGKIPTKGGGGVLQPPPPPPLDPLMQQDRGLKKRNTFENTQHNVMPRSKIFYHFHYMSFSGQTVCVIWKQRSGCLSFWHKENVCTGINSVCAEHTWETRGNPALSGFDTPYFSGKYGLNMCTSTLLSDKYYSAS